jgi:hypothetical protein
MRATVSDPAAIALAGPALSALAAKDADLALRAVTDARLLTAAASLLHDAPDQQADLGAVIASASSPELSSTSARIDKEL